MKKLFVLGVLLACTSLSWAEGTTIHMDGAPLKSDKSSVNIQGRTLVPARVLLESLGYTLGWEPITHTVKASKASFVVTLRIGETTANVNGETVPLDVPAQIVDGFTYIPLRFIAESAGATVGYDAGSGRVDISTAELQKPLSLQDPLFKQAVEEALGKTEPTVGEAWVVSSLNLSRSGITTLRGIEVFKNLKELDLSENRISDVAYLKNLPLLSTLNLSSNRIRDIRPLTDLSQLASLNLQHNNISSFLPIRSMKSLNTLWVQSNTTDDFTPLYYNLEKLKYLDIDRTLVEKPAYDTPLLSSTADFSISINKNLTWVPANALGASDIHNDGMITLLKQSPIAKRGQVDTVHEYLQMMGSNRWFKMESVEKRTGVEGGVRWQVYPGGHDTFRMNKGGQVALTVAAHYALAPDYPDMGYLLAMEGSKPYMLLNYIKTRKYIKVTNDKDEEETLVEESCYVLNSEPYLQGSKNPASPETGLIRDYHLTGGLTANIHKGSDLKVYASAWAESDPRITAIIAMKSMPAEETTAFAIGYQDGTVVFPDKYEGKSEVLFSRADAGQPIAYRSLDLKVDYFLQEPTFDAYCYK